MDVHGNKTILWWLSLLVLLCSSITTPTPAISLAQAKGCVVQADNNIVAVGNATISSVQQFAAVRYTANGDLDSAFGAHANGVVTTVVGSSSGANDVAIDSNGNIVVVGNSFTNGVNSIALVRYATDGSLDTSFNTTGIEIDLVGDACEAHAVQIQSDGKIVVSGVTNQGGQALVVLVRYNSDGSRDSSFGANGVVTTSIGYHAGAYALALDGSGNIVVAGFAIVNSVRQIAVARYSSAGVLDTTFNSTGIVTTSVGASCQANAVAIDGNGNIVVAGSTDSAMILVRYASNGSVDASFGTNGIVTTSVGAVAQANAVVIQTDGKLVVGGFSDNNFMLARYTTSGVLDASFGTSGVTATILEDNAVVNDLALQTDGKIIAVGLTDYDFALIRYTTAGALDITWGFLGIIDQPLAGNNVAPVFINDQKTVGTNGGTFTAGAWRTRDINTIVGNSTNVLVVSNQITLLPGYYLVLISAPAYKVGLHQIRLQNITDGITTAFGTSAIASTQGSSMTYSGIETNVLVGKITTFEVQHQCTTTELNDGFGIAGGFGNEIYTTVKITLL